MIVSCLLGSSLFVMSFWLGQPPVQPTNLPSEFAELVRTGDVTVEYSSDPEFVERDIGRCEFELSFRYQFTYQSRQSRRNGQTRLVITPRVKSPAVTIKHRIRLPIRFAEPGASSERLLRHEFDHVAIGLDPRPTLLLKYLAVNLPPITHMVAENEVIDDELISRLIQEALDARRAAVNALLVRNNERLDELSQHGIVRLEQRAQFFAQLNTKEQLAEQQFPYLNEALKVFAATEYDDPKLPSFVSATNP